MSLVDEFKKDCIIMEKTRTPDGEGGTVTTWSEGAVVGIAFNLDSSMESKVAQKQGVTSVYTVTFSKSVSLAYNDYIKRKEDNAIFRITSDPKEDQTPSRMAVQFMQASAEKTVLPS